MTSVALDVDLTPIGSQARPFEEWLTTFPIAAVVLDPYTYESSWILDTARRILITYKGAGCRTCWIIGCGAEDARRFLGPYADELLTFVDPERQAIAALGLEQLPAFVLVLQDGSVTASAEGWNPSKWREVASSISDLTSWNRPVIGDAGDPGPFPGTPATP